MIARMLANPIPLSRVGFGTGLATLMLACLSFAPATAATPVGHAADVDSESASNMVYKVIKSKYSSQVSGRTLETSCSGRRSPFICGWWIIKKTKERPKRCLNSATRAIESRSGEGSLHTKYCFVYKAGWASATYNTKKRSWVIVG